MSEATFGSATYCGSYRITQVAVKTDCGFDLIRKLQVKRPRGWLTIDMPLPTYIRGAYAAANWVDGRNAISAMEYRV